MKLKLSFLLVFLIQIAFGQEIYYILHVKGQVRNAEKTLAPKDKVSSTDQLQFSSETAFLVVFGNTSGRKVIKPIKQSEESPSLVSYFVSENIFPIQNQLSTRGTDEMNSFSDLKKYFASPVLVIDTLSLTLNQSSLGTNENNSLVFSSESNEIEGSFMKNDWKTSIDALSAFNQETIELSYMDKGFGSKMPICEVSLILKTFDALKAEIDFYAEVSGVTFDEISLKDHIETVYGRFDTGYLSKLLQ